MPNVLTCLLTMRPSSVFGENAYLVFSMVLVRSGECVRGGKEGEGWGRFTTVLAYTRVIVAKVVFFLKLEFLFFFFF